MPHSYIGDPENSFNDRMIVPFGIGFVIGLFVAWLIYHLAFSKKCTSNYENPSPYGYLYDTDTGRILANRQNARNALIDLLKARNQSYTYEEISRVDDPIIVGILEEYVSNAGDSDEDKLENAIKQSNLIDRLVMMVDVNYKTAKNAVDYAQNRNRGKFASQEVRGIVYNLLVKYFNHVKTPITAPLNRWGDSDLIRAFRILKLPQMN